MEYDVESERAGQAVAVSVGQAVELLNQHLFRLAGPRFLVQGEVAEYGVSQGKWVRFSLKDEQGQALLRCFMTVYQVQTEVKNGDRVVVEATPKVYERFGQFTLNVNRLEVIGSGDVAAQLARLKAQLSAEGLFDEARKRGLPLFPSRIGLVTSREAAACTDVLKILSHRWGGVQVLLAHVVVQGDRAAPSIVRAVEYFSALAESERPEVLIVTRGGGSAEELMAFNDERVVRAVFACPIPVIAAVGHERDVTLVELVADKRASTPSHAAECAVPDKKAVQTYLGMTVARLADRLRQQLGVRRLQVDGRVQSLSHAMQGVTWSVQERLRSVRAMGDVLQAKLRAQRAWVEQTERYVRELDPHRALHRGFAIVRHAGALVRRASDVPSGATLTVTVSDGELKTTVQ